MEVLCCSVTMDTTDVLCCSVTMDTTDALCCCVMLLCHHGYNRSTLLLCHHGYNRPTLLLCHHGYNRSTLLLCHHGYNSLAVNLTWWHTDTSLFFAVEKQKNPLLTYLTLLPNLLALSVASLVQTAPFKTMVLFL